MIIRRAEERDIPKMLDLLLQVNNVHNQGRPDLFKRDCRKYTASELLCMIKDDSKPIFVADVDGVVGYAFCVVSEFKNDNNMADFKTLYIDDLCVDEAKRGTNIGKSLYEYVIDYAEKIGCYNVTLNVWECNKAAQGFYRAMGLVPQKTTMEKIL